MIAARIVEDCERRAQETERLREELLRAQLAERGAKEKLQELLQATSSYSTAGMVGVRNSRFVVPDHSLSILQGGVRGIVVARCTAGQQVERLILHQEHDS